MCDSTVEVLVNDVVEFIFSQLESKDDECRTQAADADDYDRLFKKWLNETLCDLAGKCEDLGYYRGRESEQMREDLRVLATFTDAVLRGKSPELKGSNVFAILERWKNR